MTNSDIVVQPKPLGIEEVVARAIWHAQWEEAWPREGGIEHAHAFEVARAAIEAYEQAALSGSPEG